MSKQSIAGLVFAACVVFLTWSSMISDREIPVIIVSIIGMLTVSSITIASFAMLVFGDDLR